jgi:hypothetical protein
MKNLAERRTPGGEIPRPFEYDRNRTCSTGRIQAKGARHCSGACFVRQELRMSPWPRRDRLCLFSWDLDLLAWSGELI